MSHSHEACSPVNAPESEPEPGLFLGRGRGLVHGLGSVRQENLE